MGPARFVNENYPMMSVFRFPAQEILVCRTIANSSIKFEARAMTGPDPRSLAAVPLNETA